MDLRDKIIVSMLLMFCSHMTVYADLLQDLIKLEAVYSPQTSQFDNSMHNDITKEITNALALGMSPGGRDQCMQRFNTDKSKYSKPLTGQLDECHSKAPFNQNHKNSEDCLKRVIANYKTNVGKVHENLKNCMLDCLSRECA